MKEISHSHSLFPTFKHVLKGYLLDVCNRYLHLYFYVKKRLVFKL